MTVAVLVGFAAAIGAALVVQGIVYLLCSYILKRASDPATPGHIEHKIPEDILAAVRTAHAVGTDPTPPRDPLGSAARMPVHPPN